MLREKLYCFIMLVVFCVCGFFPLSGQAADKFKVLVVMSYEETFAWCKDIKEGTDSVLESTCEIRYFYMDTKTNFEGGMKKAEEAYALYQEFQPDGVITADDNAQSMFVVPYLKDKVKTPVMFCGVNAEPEKYGYPASNVSGILERNHVDQTLAFAQQLVPSIKTIGFITKESPVGNLLLKQIQDEADTYSAKFVAFRLPKTTKEVVSMAKELREQCDALFTPTLQGIPDENGKALTEKEVTAILAKVFEKPVLSNTAYSVEIRGILKRWCKPVRNRGRQPQKCY